MAVRPFLVRLIAFVGLFACMYWGLAQAWNRGMSGWLIDVATVEPAAWVARALTGDASIVADGSHLRSVRASINVLYGCEGSDVWMLLAAALLVAPIRWSRRLLGLAAGTALVFLLNQARVQLLFFAIRSRPAWFGSLHGMIAPLAVVVLVTAFYLAWLRLSASPAPDRAAAV
jgi:exosortase family protein XrtM